jgi:hypothetical protein
VPQHGLQDARWSRLWLGRRLRPWVFGCLIGLLSVTGPRISEVLNLELGGVDLEDASGGRARSAQIQPPIPTWLSRSGAAISSSVARSRPMFSSHAP